MRPSYFERTRVLDISFSSHGSPSLAPSSRGSWISTNKPQRSERFKLKLASSRALKSGIVSLEYAVEYEPA